MTSGRRGRRALFFQMGSGGVSCPKELMLSGVNVRTDPRPSRIA